MADIKPDADGFIPATIDAQDIPVAMALLSANYADQITAVLRELITNGLDAQRAEGVTAPIQVYLPTVDQPELRIVDHGTGMSTADISQVAGKYVRSPKRDAEDAQAVGFYGIGMKAPLALTDEYIVTTTQAGTTTTARFALRGGIPTHKIEQVTATDDANGTQISMLVPIDDTDTQARWLRAATTLAYWLEPGQIELYVGSSTQSHQMDSYRSQVDPTYSTQDLLFIPNRERTIYHNDRTVLMGGIAYQVPWDIGQHMIAATVPSFANKSLHISPSRESILNDDHNREAIIAALASWRKYLRTNVTADLENPEYAWQVIDGLHRHHQSIIDIITDNRCTHPRYTAEILIKQAGLPSHQNLPISTEVFGPKQAATITCQHFEGVTAAPLSSIYSNHQMLVRNEDGVSIRFSLPNLVSTCGLTKLFWVDSTEITKPVHKRAVSTYVRTNNVTLVVVNPAELDSTDLLGVRHYDLREVFGVDSSTGLNWISMDELVAELPARKKATPISLEALGSTQVNSVIYDTATQARPHETKTSLSDIKTWLDEDPTRLVVATPATRTRSNSPTSYNQWKALPGQTRLLYTSAQGISLIQARKYLGADRVMTDTEVHDNRIHLIVSRLPIGLQRKVVEAHQLYGPKQMEDSRHPAHRREMLSKIIHLAQQRNPGVLTDAQGARLRRILAKPTLLELLEAEPLLSFNILNALHYPLLGKTSPVDQLATSIFASKNPVLFNLISGIVANPEIADIRLIKAAMEIDAAG